MAVAVALAVIALAILFGAIKNADPSYGLVAVATAFTVAVVAGGYVALLVGGRPNGRDNAITVDVIDGQLVDGRRGVRIPYSRALYGFALMLVIVTVIGFAVLLPSMLLRPELADTVFAVPAVAAGLIAVPLGLWFMFDVLRGRIVRGFIVLTPRGVYHRSVLHEEFLPWNAILRITADSRQGPVIELDTSVNGVQRRFTTRVVLRRLPPVGSTRIPARGLAVDPSVAYFTMTYYLAHPTARGELETEAAIRRIRSRDLS